MEKPPKLLIVEDEVHLAEGLKDNFEFEGFAVTVARDGNEGLALAERDTPDLILLDVMLPGMDGLTVCRTLRSRGMRMPILMVTARSQEQDIIEGLEQGADDYVTKPFSIRQLTARVKAHLRRTAQAAPLETAQLGDISLDFRNFVATRGGEPLALTHREFEILRYFLKHRGETVTREQLLEHVWGITHYPLTRTVDNHIAKLRQKIEDDAAEPKWIVTVHRGGYKLLG
ncbi:MAG: response regulator transcription factor [Bryobacterales bacterium]|nr:response regulator transcription factor [Bryobacterales bacterium]